MSESVPRWPFRCWRTLITSVWSTGLFRRGSHTGNQAQEVAQPKCSLSLSLRNWTIHCFLFNSSSFESRLIGHGIIIIRRLEAAPSHEANSLLTLPWWASLIRVTPAPYPRLFGLQVTITYMLYCIIVGTHSEIKIPLLCACFWSRHILHCHAKFAFNVVF